MNALCSLLNKEQPLTVTAYFLLNKEHSSAVIDLKFECKSNISITKFRIKIS